MGFKKDFLWGAATSSAQIEGACLEDGKTLTIWESLVEGRIANGEDCKESCDHYHRYKEDVALMRQMGLKCYRFSISWARIFPDNSGVVNKKGLSFYSNLIDELLKNRIEPMITLFHWDLPMWIYNDGGYENNHFSDLFLEYTKVVVDEFSNRVQYWITINEPQCFIGAGCYYGGHAPFLRVGDERIGVITKNVMFAHGKAVKYIREHAGLSPKIGFAPTASIYMPIQNSQEEIEKAYQKTFDSNNGVAGAAWWAEPIVAGIIPSNMKFLTQDDLSVIHQPLDFYAFNIYQPENSNELKTQGVPRNSLNWAIIPECIYWASKFYYQRYNLPILVSENGMPNLDYVYEDGKVYDPQRVYYIKNHLMHLKKAISEGVEVIGFLYWSFMDNFEWTFGYDPRFGLVYVDYKTEQRIPKESAIYYKGIIATNGNNL